MTSDDVFELRKELLNLGCSANYINWKLLTKRKPLRTLYLIELILERYKEVFLKSRYSFDEKSIKKVSNRDGWTDDELEEVKELSKVIPEQVIEHLLKYIDSIFCTEQDECITHGWLYKDRYSHYDHASSIRNGILDIIEASGQQLEFRSDELLGLLTPYVESSNIVINHLIAKLLLNLLFEYSDFVISWLLARFKIRLACGNTYIEPIWILPGKLIAKFSPHCSEALFSKLENTIYFFPPTKDTEQIKWRLEERRKGYYYSYWGETQYFLLPTLANNRISPKAQNLSSVLNRKFSSYTDSYFCHSDSYTGGIVTSPLPTGNRLSNKTWRKLILTPASALSSHKLTQISEDVVSKASIEQFSRELQSSVINEPTRFAHFSLSLPQDIHKDYIDAFFYGLAESGTKQIADNYKENREACPTELLELVILHFNNENCEYSLVRLLDSRADSWSKQMVDILINLSKFSKNPEINKLTVWDPKKGNDSDSADAKSLFNTTINCVRGIAYRGISKIFWNNETFALENLEMVDHAIHDEHPAVNISAIGLLTPLLNYSNDYSHNRFISLCLKDLRMTCGYGAHHFFNQGFEGNFQSQYVDLVLEMLVSPLDKVRK